MIVTVDIWDTLLRRICHPDAVKDAVSRYLFLRYCSHIASSYHDVEKLTASRLACEAQIGADSRKRGLDDEYSLVQVYRLWLSQVGDFADSQLADVMMDLQKMEIEHEINVTYKDPGIEAAIRAHGVGTAIAISDFYMPWSLLAVILDAHGLLDLVPTGYVSCEVGLNKRSGRLFDAIPEVCANRSQWIHLGDNHHSDVVMARKAGARAYLYEPVEQHVLRRNAVSRYRDKKRALGEIQLVLNKLKSTCDGSMGRHGLDFVIPMAGFLVHIYEVALSSRASCILFFTREGVFFKSAYEALFKGGAGQSPDIHLVEVSRIATFGATLRECSISEMMRLWNQYSVQSLGTMFKSLNITPDAVLVGILEEYGLNLNEVLKNPWKDNRVISLFADKRFVDVVTGHLSASRESLLAYFSAIGLGSLDGPVVVVDIGWRGTIQDNLAYLFPGVKFIGCYWGLNNYLNKQPINALKCAYGPDLNRSKDSSLLLDMVSPVEMLTNSNTGSVIGYQRIGGVVRVLRHHDNQEDAVYNEYIAPFQSACIQGLSEVGKMFISECVTSADLRPNFYQWWRNLVLTPPAEVCESFLALNHNEFFGVGGFVSKNKSLPYWKSVLFPIVPKWSREVNAMINGIGWSHGFLSSRTSCGNLKRAYRINSLIKKIKI